MVRQGAWDSQRRASLKQRLWRWEKEEEEDLGGYWEEEEVVVVIVVVVVLEHPWVCPQWRRVQLSAAAAAAAAGARRRGHSSYSPRESHPRAPPGV